MIKVKLDNGAIFNSAHETDSGYDVCALGYRRVTPNHTLDKKIILNDGECVRVHPHETIMITTGVYLELPQPEDKGKYIEIIEAQLRPRSGASLKDSKVAILGTIDNAYRGEIGVILNNTSDYSFFIEKGERIAQVVINNIIKYKNIEIVSDINESSRGANGFGSTGK